MEKIEDVMKQSFFKRVLINREKFMVVHTKSALGTLFFNVFNNSLYKALRGGYWKIGGQEHGLWNETHFSSSPRFTT